MTTEIWELLSYVVTVVGLPLAIFVFIYEKKKEREKEDEEVYQLLSDNYQDFLNMTPEQVRRWNSWEDYMLDWCRRADFRAALPKLLEGEDPEFGDYLRKLLERDKTIQAAAFPERV